jgi:TRAP-type C4-dicarboxylate transport system permease small subunit
MNKMLQGLDRGLFRVELLVAAAAMLIIVGATGIGVFSRYVLNSPVIWAPELSLVAQIWLTFIGASAVFKERGHIGMGELTAALPRPLRLAVQAVTNLTLLAAVLIVAWTTYGLIGMQSTQTLSTLGLPRSVNSMPVAWSMVSIAISLMAELASGGAYPVRAAPAAEAGEPSP